MEIVDGFAWNFHYIQTQELKCHKKLCQGTSDFCLQFPAFLSSQCFTRVVNNIMQRRLFQKSKASKQGYINMKPHLHALCKDSETCRKSSNQIKNCSRNNITTLQKKQSLNFNVEVYQINSQNKFNSYISEFPHFFKDWKLHLATFWISKVIQSQTFPCSTGYGKMP